MKHLNKLFNLGYSKENSPVWLEQAEWQRIWRERLSPSFSSLSELLALFNDRVRERKREEGESQHHWLLLPYHVMSCSGGLIGPNPSQLQLVSVLVHSTLLQIPICLLLDSNPAVQILKVFLNILLMFCAFYGKVSWRVSKIAQFVAQKSLCSFLCLQSRLRTSTP